MDAAERSAPASAVRAAVVGAGLMGLWHARELSRVGGALVGVADRDERARSALARRHPAARPFASVDELLHAVQPLVVHLCTPLETHVDISRSCLDAGAHVLAEKPLTPDARGTQELLERAEERGLELCPVHQLPFQRGALLAREALPSIGRPVHVEFATCSAGGLHAPTRPLDEIAAEILPHPLSLFQALGVARVDELSWSLLRPREGELRAAALAGETSLSILISMNARPTRNELTLSCENGTVHLDLFHGFGHVERADVSRASKVLRPFRLSIAAGGAATANLLVRAGRREPAYPGLRELIARFYSSVRGGGPAPIPAGETLAVARAAELILS